MRRLRLVFIAALLVASGRGVVSAARPGILVTFGVEEYDVRALLEAAEAETPFTLRADGRNFVVQVERSFVRSESFRAWAMGGDAPRRVYPPLARTFRGAVLGDRRSMVSLSFGDDGITAILKTDEGWLAIEPLAETGDGLTEEERVEGLGGDQVGVAHKVFSSADLDPTFTLRCGTGPRAALSAAVGPASTAAAPREAAGVLPVLEIAAEVDHEYFARYGDTTSQQVESLVHAVSAIYESELGIRLELSALSIWETESDPYTAAGAEDLLLELRDYFNHHRRGVARDVVHLFTGRSLEGNTVGIAFVSVVCDPANGYGLSEDLGVSSLTPLVVAHELGHNLGARHDDTRGPTQYIMYPMLTHRTVDEFSDPSEASIAAYLDNVACVQVPEDPAVDDGGGADGGAPPSGSEPAPQPPPTDGGGGPVDPLSLVVLLVSTSAIGRARAARRRRPQGSDAVP